MPLIRKVVDKSLIKSGDKNKKGKQRMKDQIKDRGKYIRCITRMSENEGVGRGACIKKSQAKKIKVGWITIAQESG